MLTGHHLISRSIVWFSALVITVFAIVDLTECHGRITCYILNIAVLLTAIYGAIGAWRNDKGLLGWFLILIMALICSEIAFIIWGTVKNEGVRTILWNMILTGCLSFLFCVTFHLRMHADGEGDSYTGLPA